MSTEVANRDTDTELAVAEKIAAEVAAAQEQEYDDESLQTPILKIGQGLTREVQEGNAAVGEFINTLTGDGLGDAVEFIVAYYNRGRFASDKDGRAFVSFDKIIPATWEDFVGPEFVGTPFSEYPEAEETFKAAVNAKERVWGNGPSVSTTHNYTGLVLVEVPADDGSDETTLELQPARLSLKRIDVPAHRKLQTLLRAVLRGKPTWDAVFHLSTQKREFGKNAAYTINPTDVKIARKTTPDERLLAAQVAEAVLAGRVRVHGAEEALEDKPQEPDAQGGLEIS